MPAAQPGSRRSLTSKSMSPRAPSPTFSDATTRASAFDFGADGPAKIITRNNLKASLQAYEDLVTTCAAYRAALITMSNATASFADAMERCSTLKGPTYEAGTRLQAAAGVHHLVGNHWHVLSETLDKSFERPLRQHLEDYRSEVQERSQSYERALREKSETIRKTEAKSMNKKQRNLQSFREALTALQRQVDELDELKVTHYEEILEHEEAVWNFVQGKICIVVRSTMDVFDKFTSKASDPVIEPMLQSIPDPFDAYGPPQAEDQIFSILAPLSIMSTPPRRLASPGSETPQEYDQQSGTPPTPTQPAPWLPPTNGALYSPEAVEWPSIHSVVTPSRPTSPPGFNTGHSTSTQESVSRSETTPRPTTSIYDQQLYSSSQDQDRLGDIDNLEALLTFDLNEDEGTRTPRRSSILVAESPPGSSREHSAGTRRSVRSEPVVT